MIFAAGDAAMLSDDPYVLAKSGKVFELDHASPLMDQLLLENTKAAMLHEQTHKPRWDATYGAQWIWDHYCQLHVEKHGQYFEPDVNPDWDC
jgi:hypothetical protein